MNFSEADIEQLTASLWNSLVNVDLQSCPSDGAFHLDDPVAGSIQIRGIWEGAVSLVCSRPLARRAAAAMFSLDPPVVRPEQMRDAVGELTNVMGGNIKSLVPQPATLTLPVVEDAFTGFKYLQRGTPRFQMRFVSEGDFVTVSISQ